MADSNLQIIQRLFELSKNQLGYSPEPKGYKDAYLWLANHLNCAIKDLEREFNDAFSRAVSNYHYSLKEGKGYGWFHDADRLIHLRAQANQLIYAVYGERYISDLVFRKELGQDAYRDLIDQIDCTVLMSEEERKAHNERVNQLSKELIDEILFEQKTEEAHNS